MNADFITSRVTFPRPFALVIDDMGWMQGSSLGENNPAGPYRTGVKRTFDVNDYRYVVGVAKAAGVRIQGVFILCELDRENVLANYPTSTWQRDQWDNSVNRSDSQLECISYLKAESAWLEFGFHGIGHEYWPSTGGRRRAEWYNLEDNHPWPEATMRQHFAAAKEILAQYNLTSEHGHSFPETFVPGCYSYYWNPTGDYSLGTLLAEAGVRYANTNFTFIPELNPPEKINAGGFDHGVHVLGRLNYGNGWHELDSLPKVPLSMQPTDIVETHWANWLAADDFLQPAVNERWINYYREVSSQPDRFAARNTAELHSQWLYKNHATVTSAQTGELLIDNSRMPDEAYANGAAGNLVLRIIRNRSEKLLSCSLDNEPAPVFLEHEHYIDLYLPLLEARHYTLKYELGDQYADFAIPLTGTYNVLATKIGRKRAVVSLRMYGRQNVAIICRSPGQVQSDNAALIIHSSKYEESTRILTLDMEASDYQGVNGKIFIEWTS